MAFRVDGLFHDKQVMFERRSHRLLWEAVLFVIFHSPSISEGCGSRTTQFKGKGDRGSVARLADEQHADSA